MFLGTVLIKLVFTKHGKNMSTLVASDPYSEPDSDSKPLPVPTVRIHYTAVQY
jgi:hypothetical protein